MKLMLGLPKGSIRKSGLQNQHQFPLLLPHNR